jgi:hypothetical protein
MGVMSKAELFEETCLTEIAVDCIYLAGNLSRGLAFMESYKLLKEGMELTEDEIFLASALGWCIKWVWHFKTSRIQRLFMWINLVH